MFKVVVRYTPDEKVRECDFVDEREAWDCFRSELLLGRAGVWLYYKGMKVSLFMFNGIGWRCALMCSPIGSGPVALGIGRWALEALRDAVDFYELSRWCEGEAVGLETALLAEKMRHMKEDARSGNDMMAKALDIRGAIEGRALAHSAMCRD